MQYDDTVILLFAKAPVAGYVNTRLIADIGVQAATRLQHELVNQRLSMLAKADLCTVYLLCAPDRKHEFFQRCKQQYPVVLSSQSGTDIGDRMFNAVKAALQKYRYCIVIGSDAPALDAETIKHAIDALRADARVVFVPAEDGGYVLAGLQHAYDFMFQDINWGSSAVMKQTKAKLKSNNVSYSELATCWDVDRLEDYQRYLEMKNLPNQK